MRTHTIEQLGSQRSFAVKFCNQQLTVAPPVPRHSREKQIGLSNPGTAHSREESELHGGTPNRIVASADGVYIRDTEPRKSLDGYGALYRVDVGYGCTEIADAIARQAMNCRSPACKPEHKKG